MTIPARDSAIDLIRVVALFCVVLVHTHLGKFESDTPTGLLELLFFFVGKLGVPLFVMISGALLLPKEDTYGDFYKKRLKKIILPWLVWAMLLLVYKMYSGMVITSSFLLTIKEFLIVLLSDFWFIPMILGLYLLTPYIRSVIFAKVPLHHLLLGWFAITSIAPSLYLSPLFPGSSSAGLFTLILSFLGYFVLGWYIRSYFLKTSLRLLLMLVVISAAIYVLGFTFFQGNADATFFVLHDYFSPAIVVGSVATFLILLQRAKSIMRIVPATIIKLLSNSSYGIFLSHALILSLVSSLMLSLESEDNLFHWIIRAVLIYSISALVVLILTKPAALRKFFT
jgi:surface polysaccharide O-acyltransferase-like enzyme